MNVVATYEYTDRDGKVLYAVDRLDPKSFRQRRPNGDGEWIYNLDGVERVLYKLPKVIESTGTVFITEGEKDVHTLEALGFTATTAASGKYSQDMLSHLGGSDVVILVDNDGVGLAKGGILAEKLSGIAKTVKVVWLPELPKGGDITDFFEAGRTVKEFSGIVEATPLFERAPESDTVPAAPAFPPTDTTNAELVLEKLGAKAMHCRHGRGCDWYLADETERWSLDRTNRLAEIVQGEMKKRWLEIAANPDPKDPRFKHAIKSLDAKAIRDCIEILEFQQRLAVLPEQLDSNPFLLGVRNGILDLQARELIEPRLDLLVTKCAPVIFSPDAECVEFQKYLTRVQPDQDVRAFLQRLAGSLLTGMQPEQSLIFFYGCGANGKSAFVRTLTDVLGPDYVFKARKQLLFVSGRRSEYGANDVVDLEGKRLITSTEQTGRSWNLEFLKDFTGGEPQHGRQLYKRAINFKPVGKILVSANQKPRLTEFDEAMRRRFVCLPWPVVIPEEERVTPLELYVGSLLGDGGGAGVLNWALKGLQDLIERNWRLDPPQSAVEATMQYIKQEDLIGRFFAEWFEDCDPSEMRESFTTKELRKHFALWSDTPDQFLISPKRFTQECKRIFGERCHILSDNRYVIDGLRFNEEGGEAETRLRRELREQQFHD